MVAVGEGEPRERGLALGMLMVVGTGAEVGGGAKTTTVVETGRVTVEV